MEGAELETKYEFLIQMLAKLHGKWNIELKKTKREAEMRGEVVFGGRKKTLIVGYHNGNLEFLEEKTRFFDGNLKWK